MKHSSDPTTGKALRHVTSVILVLVGLVNIAPVAGVLSASMLSDAYGIASPDGDLLILMRHRALLFGIVGGLLLVSAFRRHLRSAAILSGMISMSGFIALTLIAGEHGEKIHRIMLIDMAATIALAIAVALHYRDGHAAPASRR